MASGTLITELQPDTPPTQAFPSPSVRHRNSRGGLGGLRSTFSPSLKRGSCKSSRALSTAAASVPVANSSNSNKNLPTIVIIRDPAKEEQQKNPQNKPMEASPKPMARRSESVAEKRSKKPGVEKKPPAEYGKGRRRLFVIRSPVREGQEGLITGKNKAPLMSDKRMQLFIMASELRALEGKTFQLRFMLRRGVKALVGEVVRSIPLDCLISLNSKLELLCGMLYEIGFILLQGSGGTVKIE